jgi:uncharacterized membrane protein (GlpM family)
MFLRQYTDEIKVSLITIIPYFIYLSKQQPIVVEKGAFSEYKYILHITPWLMIGFCRMG